MTVASRPITDRINLVYLYVRDLDRSIAFYRDLLGLPLVRDERDAHWAEAKLPGGVRFALHLASPRGGGPCARSAHEPEPGSVKIDFETADIDAAIARLRAAGVSVGEAMREYWGSVVEVQDPDGYRIDLFQPPRR